MGERNSAYVDGQNLYLGTCQGNPPWFVDYRRFRMYLRDKYRVSKAFYYIGYKKKSEKKLYANLQSAGFILVFKPHTSSMVAKKKGNVDSDIIFDVMRSVADKSLRGKVVLVSGDGDYKRMTDYLAIHDKLKHILFPNRASASSLYKTSKSNTCSSLDEPDVRRKIEYVSRGL